MISTIIIFNKPYSDPGKSLTLVGYSIVLRNNHWIQAILTRVTISLTSISQPPIELRLTMLMYFDNQSFWEVLDLHVCSKTICLKISQRYFFQFFLISKVLWWLQIKHNKMMYLFQTKVQYQQMNLIRFILQKKLCW